MIEVYKMLSGLDDINIDYFQLNYNNRSRHHNLKIKITERKAITQKSRSCYPDNSSSGQSPKINN